MINSDLVLRVNIYTAQDYIQFFDNTDYINAHPGLLDLSCVLGCLTVISPLGVEYTNSDFRKPDIDPDNISGTGRYFNGIAIPVDISGKFLCGTYTFIYHLMTYDIKTLVPFNIVGVNQTLKQFVVSGDASAVTGVVSCMIPTVNANAGGYTVKSAVYDGTTNTTITVNEDIPSPVVAGTFCYLLPNAEYTWDGAGGTTALSGLKFTDYICYTLPDVRIDNEVNCAASLLTANDVTNYNVTCNGNVISASSLDRTYTYKYPTDLPTIIPDVVHSQAGASDLITPIYTGVWKVTLETLANYQLSQYTSLYLDLIGNETTNCQCDACICQLYNCIVAMVIEYNQYLTDNPSMAQTYYDRIFKVLMYKMLWDAAERCGKTHDMEKWCRKIKDIVKEAKCSCDIDKTTSRLIVPITGLLLGTGGTGAAILSGNAPPTSGQGNNGDWYFLTIAPFVVYKKVGGAWIPQFTIPMGLPGSQILTGVVAPTTQGNDGDWYILKVFPFTLYEKISGTWVAQFNITPISLLWNQIVPYAMPADLNEHVMDDYAMPADTVTVGNCLLWKVTCALAADANDKTIRLFLDTNKILEYVVTGSSPSMVTIETELDFISTNSIRIETKVTVQGLPCYVAAMELTFLAGESYHNMIHMMIKGQNSVAVAGEIAMYKSRIELLK